MAQGEQGDCKSKVAAHLSIGRLGEDITARWLENRSWEILERNWRCAYSEVDIIARQNAIVAFVEVKTRTHGYLASPLEAISPGKRQKLLKAAWLWLEQTGIQEQPRFDVAAVVIDGKSRILSFDYIESAFDGSDE